MDLIDKLACVAAIVLIACIVGKELVRLQYLNDIALAGAADDLPDFGDTTPYLPRMGYPEGASVPPVRCASETEEAYRQRYVAWVNARPLNERGRG